MTNSAIITNNKSPATSKIKKLSYPRHFHHFCQLIRPTHLIFQDILFACSMFYTDLVCDGGNLLAIISIFDGDRCMGQCDEDCYDSNADDCSCVCGGLNHGVGRDQAIKNTLIFLDDLVLEYGIQHPGCAFGVEIN